MSASTEGTPEWLMRLEQAQAQLKPENYINWLLEHAPKHGIPANVIESQLERNGYTIEKQETVDKDEQVAVEDKPKRGRKPKEQ
jgi:N-acetyl-anhydromuramyl-L-alanine amidase AmpD